VAIFADRADAGRRLAAALSEIRDPEAVVFGIPRGGVIVAAEVARALGLPLASVASRTPTAPPLRGRTAIVVDDGIATGATATAACRSVKARGAARIVLAVPVAPAAWRPDQHVVDQYVCPHPIRDFWAVGPSYRDFTQTTDEEVTRALLGDSPATDDSGGQS
jgi:putative phosphoribosyl transferase